ncbi:hypothetical protein [Synechococcus phage Ssp-JY39]|nr:hypothetical protein [Synechococcus phage Yong-M2-251]
MRVVAAIAACALMSGCAGANYAMEHYSGVPIQQFKASSGATYRIFDKPAENRLMITSSIGDALGSGAVQGMTLGAVRPTSAAVVFRDAAEEYLASTGRKCTTRDTTLVIDSQYEVRYECATAVADGSSPALATAQ